LFYWIATFIRNKFYDWGIFESTSFDLPIICIGNLNVGGTGKSPHTIYVADLLKNDYLVAILSRGYGRLVGGFKVANYHSNFKQIGDEPMQTFLRFKNKVIVAVCESRVLGVKNLRKEYSPKVIILDDAFQHREIKAGFNILLTAYDDLFTKDYLLPAGNLRESAIGKKRAQIVIVTKCPENITDEQKKSIQSQLKLKHKQDLFFSKIVYNDEVISSKYRLHINELENYSVLLVSGIANDKPLVEFTQKNTKDVHHIHFKDHHHYTQKDVDFIMSSFKKIEGEKIILTTEKDYTRLMEYSMLLDDLYFIPINIKIDKEEEFNHIIQSYNIIKDTPEYAIVLGSGLSKLQDEVEKIVTINYKDIPHFPQTTVQGHSGSLIYGTIEGKKVLMMSGRFHYYEGYSMKEVTFPFRVFKLLGIEKLIVSNASGGVNSSFNVGDIMLIKDHINFFPEHPLRGANLDEFGPRFPDMSQVYDKQMISIAQNYADNQGFTLRQGIYLGLQGPTFETPSEYEMIKKMGADAVGMSTVPEIIVARHQSMRCFAISIITDVGGKDLEVPVSHEEVLQAAQNAMPNVVN
ncbi:unnamed protein product, partial [Cyprideis torosa]